MRGVISLPDVTSYDKKNDSLKNTRIILWHVQIIYYSL